jgi:CheY-like chemotaxis protein
MTTILVVDDSKFSRGRSLVALANEGYTLREAVDGRDALEQIAAAPPDLIISDLLMPNLDGFGLLRALQERGTAIPVIIVSADIQATSRALCEELGAAKFLNKPFQPDELRNAVTQVLPQTVGAR